MFSNTTRNNRVMAVFIKINIICVKETELTINWFLVFVKYSINIQNILTFFSLKLTINLLMFQGRLEHGLNGCNKFNHDRVNSLHYEKLIM